MLVIMDSRATAADIQRVKDRIVELGYQPHPIPGANRLAIGVTGNKGAEDRIYLEGLAGVATTTNPTDDDRSSIDDYRSSTGGYRSDETPKADPGGGLGAQRVARSSPSMQVTA